MVIVVNVQEVQEKTAVTLHFKLSRATKRHLSFYPIIFLIILIFVPNDWIGKISIAILTFLGIMFFSYKTITDEGLEFLKILRNN